MNSDYRNLDESNRKFREQINRKKGITEVDEMREIAERCIRTTMIGSLSKFEDVFGDWWGEFKDESEPLTEQEEKMLQAFEVCRKSILDLGNAEIRRLGLKFSNYKGNQ